MKTPVFLLLGLVLLSIQAPAQSINTPYSWTTIGGNYGIDFQVGYVFGTAGYANGNGSDARFGNVYGLAVDVKGNLYVADTGNQVIRKMTPGGTNWVVTTLAGQPGVPGALDGTGNQAQFSGPNGVAVDGTGIVYVADTGNNEIRRITPDGTVTTIAGDPSFICDPASGTCYRDGPGSQAVFNQPFGVAVDTNGNLYVSDTGNDVIRKMTPPQAGSAAWQVSTLAGTTNVLFGGCGDCNGQGVNAGFNVPEGLAVDSAGNVYVADSNNNKIRKVTPDGVVSDLAGAVQQIADIFAPGAAYGSKDGPAAAAEFYTPYGVAVDGVGNVYVVDNGNDEYRKVTPDGLVTTLGGNPVAQGDFIPEIPQYPFYIPIAEAYADGVGGAARFYGPNAVAVDLRGNLYVADTYNFLIRKGVAPVVQVVALEVTQVIQDWSNSIPLVAGKETYLRAHLQLTPAAQGAVLVSHARLYGYDAGSGAPLAGSPTAPINQPDGSLMVQTPAAADVDIRGHFAKSLNFRLPPEWSSGSITLQLAWSGGLESINVVSGNSMVDVTFVPAAVPQVRFYDVSWTDVHGANHQVGSNLFDLPLRVLSCYPVARVEATFAALHMPTNQQPRLEDVNNLLGVVRFLETGLDFFSPNPSGNWIYHGAIPAAGGAGLADAIPSFVSSDNVLLKYGYGRQTDSHELGHNLGRQHDVDPGAFSTTNHYGALSALGACGEEGLWTYAYPLFQPFPGYTNGAPTLGPMTNGDNSLIYGLDSLTLRTAVSEPVLSPVIDYSSTPPNWYFDVMSYCTSGGPEDLWPSSVTYPALLSSINTTFGPPAPAPTPPPPGFVGGGLGGGVGVYLLVRGTVDFNAGTAQLLPCLPLTTTNLPSMPPAGTNYLLQALDGLGNVLQAIQFGLQPRIVEGESTNQTASFIVPFSADPSIQMLRLFHQGALLAALTASPRAPTVTLTTPNGGQNFATGTINVAWTGTDADGDALTYTVQYSPDDGATWKTLVVDWPGENLDVDSAELQATTNGLIRVTASDGFNTAGAQSAAPFTVQPHAPAVTINSPRDGSIFMADNQLFLDASANDMQDGVLGGTNVQWYSDRDGALGGGAILTFNATKLSEGYHTITVTATDSAGLTNSAVTHLLELHYTPPQLGITVAPPSAVLSWPSDHTNYALQSSASLASGWITITNPPPMALGSRRIATVGLSKGNSFFRLMLHP